MITEIVPGRSTARSALSEAWADRELAAFLVWRDLKVRYRQTVFGAAWAVLQPLGLMLVFSVFLGHLAKIPSGHVPYPLFVLSGLVPWIFVSGAVDAGANSLVTNLSLVTKVQFPRIILPLAAGLSVVLDLLIGVVLVIGLAIVAGPGVDIAIALLPIAVLWLYTIATSVGTMLAGLSVRYRDLRHALRFLLQLWMFLSPVAYPISLVPGQWRVVYGLNPLASAIGLFRWALIGDPAPTGAMFGASIAITAVLIWLGIAAFLRSDDVVADLS